ncbi:esterase [Flavobacterium sediminis]|uniref:Esterase n=1 Tax=Flavobacterium sediminis TaxID=2201181 RepID=A0A2U8QXR3_9FLAO|nr:alpha/beta hydrolase [Flavobacterium sediminis]AWM15007.1 esterase [Flavobacterium sediminis]
MNYTFHLFFCLVMINSFAFQKTNDQDLYTVQSEWQKRIKEFPEITIVKAKDKVENVTEKEIVYQMINGIETKMDMYQFQSEENKPAVILIHGGGWKYGDKKLVKPLAQQIAKAGYQCFAVAYRKSGEAIYPAGVNDVLNAVQFIREHSNMLKVDTLNIAILGCSSGGQMAALLGTKYSDRFKAIVDIDGVLAFHHPESKEGAMAAEWLGGTYEKVPEVWEEASALNYISEAKLPMLFINSQYERFHAGRDEMIEQLNKKKIYSEIVTVKDSPHTFWLFHPWFDEIIPRILNFLNNQLN